MKYKNRRKFPLNIKSKVFLSIYIFLTLAVILCTFGGVIYNLFFSFLIPDLVFSINPRILIVIFLLWTIYGYIMAYYYATSRIQYVIFRMANVFDRIKEGKIHKMSFRKNDKFYEVAQRFNQMIQAFVLKKDMRTRLQNISKDVDVNTQRKIEAIIQDL